MKQKELKQLSRHIINGEKEERLSTLTMEEKAKLLKSKQKEKNW